MVLLVESALDCMGSPQAFGVVVTGLSTVTVPTDNGPVASCSTMTTAGVGLVRVLIVASFMVISG